MSKLDLALEEKKLQDHNRIKLNIREYFIELASTGTAFNRNLIEIKKPFDKEIGAEVAKSIDCSLVKLDSYYLCLDKVPTREEVLEEELFNNRVTTVGSAVFLSLCLLVLTTTTLRSLFSGVFNLVSITSTLLFLYGVPFCYSVYCSKRAKTAKLECIDSIYTLKHH